MIEIGFPNSSGAEAAILAQQLQRALIRAGASDQDISLSRERSDTMDPGSILTYAKMALEVAVLLKCLWEIVGPSHSSVSITTPRGTFVLEPSQLTVENLQKIMSAVPKDERKN